MISCSVRGRAGTSFCSRPYMPCSSDRQTTRSSVCIWVGPVEREGRGARPLSFSVFLLIVSLFLLICCPFIPSCPSRWTSLGPCFLFILNSTCFSPSLSLSLSSLSPSSSSSPSPIILISDISWSDDETDEERTNERLMVGAARTRCGSVAWGGELFLEQWLDRVGRGMHTCSKVDVDQQMNFDPQSPSHTPTQHS